MSQPDQPSSKQPISGVPQVGAVPPEQALPPRALSSKAAAATNPPVKVTTPMRAVQAFPRRAAVMLEVSSVTPPSPSTPGVAASNPVEIVSALAPQQVEVLPEPEPEAASPATQTPKILGIGMDPSQVLAEVIAQRQQDLIQRLQQMGVQRGQILFDGRWMNPDDATSAFRGMRFRSWRTVFEAILLTGAMVASAGVIGILLAVLAGLQVG
jgi:hypothetical protein